ncbi:putative LysM domain protein [Aspergillus undulatus]|uniref:putative LysM domain protein n=1 Tax=Aspergillus undulatus TaxID=1810928 RepID=UPI003CCDD652
MSSRSGSADTFTQRSASTVRPRRLMSFTEDDGDNTGRQNSSSGLSTMRSSELPSLRSRGATPSSRPSPTVSPIPKGHPSRVTQGHSGSQPGNSLGGFFPNGKHQDPFAESSRAAVDFLDASWSSLQGIASSLLGSDIARPTANGAPRSHARKPSRPDYFTKPPTNSSTWGPSGPSTPEIGAGTQEERQAMVHAKKMEALLLADTDPSWNLNSRHKRRESGDRPSLPVAAPEQDEEALVYVHQVQPTDSITGVTIRYGCQAAIFRKANGFWPSDSIQGRKTVLLPVDCCSVKGRPVQSGRNIDLLQDIPSRSSIEDTSGSSIVPAPSPETSTFSKGSDQTSAEESDQIWKHESWVQIDGFPAHVEIGRVPRRALGFFPRTRRKSLSYSDSEPVRSREQTPINTTASSPIQPVSPQNDRLNVSSPRSRGSGRPGGGHRRQRSGLEFSGTGVGTLDRNVNLPGPAMDGLSKFFAQHMPTLAPKQAPPNFEDFSGNSSTVASSNSTSLDSIGGAVEGWVRKMTARAKSSINDLQQGTSSSQSHALPPDTGRRGFGDLIELDDGVESRNSSGLLSGPSWKPNLTRSGSSYTNGANLRGRFPTASPSTSRTRTGFKDD